jgi:hypothetical protein
MVNMADISLDVINTRESFINELYIQAAKIYLSVKREGLELTRIFNECDPEGDRRLLNEVIENLESWGENAIDAKNNADACFEDLKNVATDEKLKELKREPLDERSKKICELAKYQYNKSFETMQKAHFEASTNRNF